MNLPDLVSWLQQKTYLGSLSEEVLGAIASVLSELVVGADEIVITENEQSDGLYILQSGKIENDSKLNALQSSLLSGTVLNLYALLLEQPTWLVKPSGEELAKVVMLPDCDRKIMSFYDGVIW